jgi:hypothetical protein
MGRILPGVSADQLGLDCHFHLLLSNLTPKDNRCYLTILDEDLNPRPSP